MQHNQLVIDCLLEKNMHNTMCLSYAVHHLIDGECVHEIFP